MAIAEWVLIVVNILLVCVTGWYARATHQSVKLLRKHTEIARLGAEIQACEALVQAGSQNQRPAIQSIAEQIRNLTDSLKN